MTRLNASLAVAAAALLAVTPALAADYPHPTSDANFFGNTDDMRSGFSSDFDNSDAYDPLNFEFGLRYWYSMGAQNFSINSGLAGDRGKMSETDHAQSVEGHFRIDDNSTKTYVKGVAGLAFSIDGSSDDKGGTVSVTNGKIGYAGADIGYSLLGDGKKTTFGPFAGYMYWNDSPNTYADNYTTAASASDATYNPVTGQTSFPGDSQPNNIEMNMLRLGLSGKSSFGSMFDISGEVAAVPYAKISGILGAGSGFSSGAPVSYDNQSGVPGTPTGLTGAFNVHDIQSSPTTIDGWGYGAMGEAMVGFHPNDNWTFRLGGRAWYLQGTADAKYSRAVIGDPTDSNQPTAGTPASAGPPPVAAGPPNLNSPNFDTPPTFSNQEYISRANPWSVLRYGILAEMTYSF